MKSVMLSKSDSSGGAAIAAYRIHKALLSHSVDSKLWVDNKGTDDWTVETHSSGWRDALKRIRPIISKLVGRKLVRDTNNSYRSLNVLKSAWTAKINASDADLVHLQWVNGEMLSISDLARLNPPIIQTMHDMWPFCGAEHYAQNDRWRTGYDPKEKPSSIQGLDVDSIIWKLKKRHWKNPWQIVAISNWQADCIRSSKLLGDFPVTVIPNPIDTAVWKPIDKRVARELHNLPADKTIVAFGAINGTKDLRKGYQQLTRSLSLVKENISDIHLVVFGQSQPKDNVDTIFPTTYAGSLKDSQALSSLYNAADVFVIPSLQEAFGQTASEAQACGTPTVAFGQTGCEDIVAHKITGYLAKHGSHEDFAAGIQWVIENSSRNGDSSLSIQARDRALRYFSYEVVGSQYKKAYASVINNDFLYS